MYSKKELKVYTPRVEGFEIRDVVYFGYPPKDAPISYDIVKWYTCEPREVLVLETGKREMRSEGCYSVGTLEWNEHEPCFEFSSVGLRWLEERPSDAVIEMVMKFCEEKEKELIDLQK